MDSLQRLYDRLFDLDAEHVDQPEDFYTTLSEATETTGDEHYVDMDALHMLYLFDFYKIVKIGGINSPYACIEWHGIQIPQAILSLMEVKGLRFTFCNNRRTA